MDADLNNEAHKELQLMRAWPPFYPYTPLTANLPFHLSTPHTIFPIPTTYPISSTFAWPTRPFAKSTLYHAPCRLIPILIPIEAITVLTPHIPDNHHKHTHLSHVSLSLSLSKAPLVPIFLTYPSPPVSLSKLIHTHLLHPAAANYPFSISTRSAVL